MKNYNLIKLGKVKINNFIFINKKINNYNNKYKIYSNKQNNRKIKMLMNKIQKNIKLCQNRLINSKYKMFVSNK